MPENPNPTPSNDGISEDELRGMISETLDSKLEERGITAEAFERLGKLDILDSIGEMFEKNKSEPVDSEGLLTKVSEMLDDKLKGFSSGSGGGNGKSERKPRINIFNS